MTTNIFHVNDDQDISSIVGDILGDYFDLNGGSLYEFEDLMTATNAAAPCDLLIIDMSAVSPYLGGPEGFYSPMAAWMTARPNTPIIVASGVDKGFVADVMDRIRELDITPPPVKYLELGMFFDLRLVAAIEDVGIAKCPQKQQQRRAAAEARKCKPQT